jgi:hypothetical protein
LESTAIAGDSLFISLVLTPSDVSGASGFGEFRLRVNFSIGKVLHVKLDTNFSVIDVDNIRIEGLANAEYLDKPDQFARKSKQSMYLRFVKKSIEWM